MQDPAKFPLKISFWVPKLVGQLESSHWEVQDAAGRALSKLAYHGQFLSG